MKLLLAVLALLALLYAVPARGGPPTTDLSTGTGWFHADCAPSNRAPDDPIVYYRGPGQAHMHDFFGPYVHAGSKNGETDWPDSIRGAGQARLGQGEYGRPTTCQRDGYFSDADRSAYWVPTLYVNDKPVQPLKMQAGYGVGRGREYEKIEAFPPGLKIIAGKSDGSQPQAVNGQNVYYWMCYGEQVAPAEAANKLPTCKDRVLIVVVFPDCWDGVNEDSRDHMSHMAYSRYDDEDRYYRCPSTHPVFVPQTTLKVIFNTEGGPTARLSSGGLQTMHADFMNGWNQDSLKGLIERCLHTDRYCGGGDSPAHGH